MTTYSTTHNAANGYYRGAVDGNGFYVILRWNVTQNIQNNTSTIQASYILQETNNNFSTYSCTTYLRSSTTGSFATGNYTNLYNPSSTIQYSAMTTNTYYWIGNSTLNQETQIDTAPSSAYIFTQTISHDSAGNPPAYYMLRGYIDSNTNTTYVPEGTIATYDLVANGLIDTIPIVFKTGQSIAVSTASRPTTSTLSFSGNTVLTNTGATPTYQYSLSTDGGSTWGAWTGDKSSPSWTNISITAAQQYNIRIRAYTATDTVTESGTGYASYGIPSTVSAPSISNVVTTNLTLSWTAPANNGATISSYTIQASTNNGTSWSNLATGITSTTYDATGLTIAATYRFRILAINSVGTSAAGTTEIYWSPSQFISAYGYRYTSGNTKVAIAMAARYTGNAGDSVVVNGTTYTGWKMLSGIKRYTSTGWSDLQS